MNTLQVRRGGHVAGAWLIVAAYILPVYVAAVSTFKSWYRVPY